VNSEQALLYYHNSTMTEGSEDDNSSSSSNTNTNDEAESRPLDGSRAHDSDVANEGTAANATVIENEEEQENVHELQAVEAASLESSTCTDACGGTVGIDEKKEHSAAATTATATGTTSTLNPKHENDVDNEEENKKRVAQQAISVVLAAAATAMQDMQKKDTKQITRSSANQEPLSYTECAAGGGTLPPTKAETTVREQEITTSTMESMAVSLANGIQPFPSPPTRPSVAQVGAHAIGGPPRFFNPVAWQQQLPNNHNDNQVVQEEEEEEVYGTDAFLVPPDTEYDNEAPPPSIPLVERPSPYTHTSTNATSAAHSLPSEEVILGQVIPDRPTTRNPSTRRNRGQDIVPGGVPESRTAIQKRRALWLWMGLVVGLVIVVGTLAIVLPLVLAKKNNNNSNVQVPLANQSYTGSQAKTNDTSLLYPPFREDLHPAILPGIQTIGSQHYHANLWMLQDPHLHSYSPDRQLQRFHFVAFFHYTHGQDWFQKDHWLSHEISECLWFTKSPPDVPVCNDQEEILVINQTNNNLSGSFAPHRQFIPTLQTIDISHNHMTGEVPSLYDASALRAFVVSNNGFRGQIKAGTFTAFNIQILKLDGNQLQGTYDSLVWSFIRHLEIFNVSNNRFSGTIAPEIDVVKNLTYFGIANNAYHGSIPSTLGTLTGLTELNVAGNEFLIGTIPTELGALPALTYINVMGTSLTGTIPDSICQLNSSIDVRANCSSLVCC